MGVLHWRRRQHGSGASPVLYGPHDEGFCENPIPEYFCCPGLVADDLVAARAGTGSVDGECDPAGSYAGDVNLPAVMALTSLLAGPTGPIIILYWRR